MILESFGSRKTVGPRILETVAHVTQSSNDAIESTRLGFAFPVHEKIRNLGNKTVHSYEDKHLDRLELMKTALTAVDRAWKEAIQPRIEQIRKRSVPVERRKGKGTDFFTVADTASERLIRDALFKKFGKNNLRIFGEEKGAYMGNIESQAGVRIDPIDGTQNFKAGMPDWGIMVGVYEGTREEECQVQGVAYLPERNKLICFDEHAGVFVTDTGTGKVNEIGKFQNRDNLKEVLVTVWTHTDPHQTSDRIKHIESALAVEGGVIRSAGNCVDVLV